MLSTRQLSLLPNIERLRRTWQSMALLDAILFADWELRYYSFIAAWAEGEPMGSVRDDGADHLPAHLSPAGCWLTEVADPDRSVALMESFDGRPQTHQA